MKIAVFLVMLTVLCFGEVHHKIMVNLTTGDQEKFFSHFLGGVKGTTEFFCQKGENVDTVVVIHGEAYKFFVEHLENTQYGTDPKLADAQETIHQKLMELFQKYNVRFEVCRIGMNGKGILTQDIYPFVVPINSAMIGLVKWQNEGYAYVPVQ